MNGKQYTKVFANSETCLVDGEWITRPDVARQSEKAICFKFGGNNVWIPRTSIHSEGVASDGSWWLEIPLWMAKDKGIFGWW
jgi:hypothetical protein